jgi:biopolymer transport protein ExbB/TolQ
MPRLQFFFRRRRIRRNNTRARLRYFTDVKEEIMFTFFIKGGEFMWLLLIIALVILVLAIKKSSRLFGRKAAAEAADEAGIHAVLFWGVLAAVMGLLGHVFGLYLAMQAVADAKDISPAIVAKGYNMSLTTLLSGLIILVVSALVWFTLLCRLRVLKKAYN